MNNLLIYAIFIGIGATIVMDLFALLLLKIFGIPSLNYALVGRWIGGFSQGKFTCPNIIQAHSVRGEHAIGWAAHYSIGIAFALVLLLIEGLQWVDQPTLLPALIVGVLTTVAPFFIMQPAFGFGFAASKTPKPTIARLRSLQAHTVYGVGLYLAGLLLSMLIKY
ncbi:DUF2938 domain-containing protein [Myroides pelagicus]|uniref:DUF2938 family protein n=1 Tax=Myroides pelagicus TaxID=270914 RepID=A0A7K1GH15_9FLAO|nr:DUF2938 domain-containing protein [Myroides pelagicus]MEC4113504.1 DUF2938 domain-containing protein [Myroides pelagicus]MTH28341.1 DUF2938 family protein [Myroides pelagicus]